MAENLRLSDAIILLTSRHWFSHLLLSHALNQLCRPMYVKHSLLLFVSSYLQLLYWLSWPSGVGADLGLAATLRTCFSFTFSSALNERPYCVEDFTLSSCVCTRLKSFFVISRPATQLLSPKSEEVYARFQPVIKCRVHDRFYIKTVAKPRSSLVVCWLQA